MDLRRFRRPHFVIPSILFSGQAIFSNWTHASMPEEVYKSALQLAEKKAKRIFEARARSQSPAFSAIKILLGRTYNVGDSWTVASWQFQHATMRMTGEEDHLKGEISDGGLFRYEVINVDSPPNQQVTLQITQIQSHGYKLIDPKVVKITLTMDDRLSQNDKTYFFEGESKGLHVSPENVRSRMTPIELFPLDIPDVVTAERQKPAVLPALPSRIKTAMDNLGVKLTLTNGSWYEQDDFFGRPIQVLWQKGDPWPLYLKTANGISVLVKESL